MNSSKQMHDLEERVKELNCLYGISKIVEKNLSLEETLQSIVDIIPPAWQYPEITCVRIVFEDQTFQTANFKESNWKQISQIIVHGEIIGVLEVFYLEEKSEIDEGSFLKDERKLINTISEWLGRIIERKRAEEELIQYRIHLEELVEKRTGELINANKKLQQEIIERKQVEESLKKYTEELKRSNQLKELFTDILRHDLINPANIIKGFTDVLLDMEEDEKKIQVIETIKRNNEKLINMIETAAKFSKLEGVKELDFEKMDISSIFRGVVENFKPQLEEKQMIIEFAVEGEYPANVNLIIEDVFANLLSNAIKYSPPESKIIIDVLDADEEWKVTVTDFGEGITDEDKPKLFERFKRVSKGGVKGTGLGLAIVKRIIDLHGGSVGVEDNPAGQGSVFWITVRKA